MRLWICMPVFEDWQSAEVLLAQIDRELEACPAVSARVLLVDDGSPELGPLGGIVSYRKLLQVDVLVLRRNLGHQRAIAIGLAALIEADRADAVAVMDADGEDTPAGLRILLAEYLARSGRRVVFAERRRRMEGAGFKFCYLLYRVIHWLMTGQEIRVGNFSILGRQHGESLMVVSELWNHYAAAVFKARLPTQLVPVDRGRRIAGCSRMNFAQLVAHGMSAIAVFADIVGTRMLVGGTGALLAIGALLGCLSLVKLIFGGVVLESAIAGTTLLLGLGVILVALILVASMLMLNGRSGAGFLPLRDYAYFIRERKNLWTRPDA